MSHSCFQVKGPTSSKILSVTIKTFYFELYWSCCSCYSHHLGIESIVRTVTVNCRLEFVSVKTVTYSPACVLKEFFFEVDFYSCHVRHVWSLKLYNIETSWVADLRGALPAPPKIFSFSCSFLGKFGKIVCWHPSPRGLAPPPTANPGTAPVRAKLPICVM